MASANLALPARRDWILANPWAWMGVGLVSCAWAWAWTRTFGTQASDYRALPVALGVLAAGAAVALRLGSSRPALVSQLGAAWQQRLGLVLATLFGLLAAAVTVVLVLALQDSPFAPFYTGQACLAWCLLAPLSVAAARQCLRRVRKREPVGVGEEAAALLFLSSATAMLGSMAFDLRPELPRDWDTMRLFLRVVSGVLLIAAGLAAASTRARRLAISALILYHFGGICTASLSAPPVPWIVNQVWLRIYRPYLEFMYLNNAYHFYAPEPGPASYVWLRLIYTDTQEGGEVGVWLKIPQVDEQGRPQHTVALEYQRMLALTEGTVLTDTPPPSMEINAEGQPQVARFLQRRMEATPDPVTIIGRERPSFTAPFDPQVLWTMQYAAPSQAARDLLESFARHGASLPHPDEAKEPGRYQISRVKIYRVTHAIPDARLLAAGGDVLRDPTQFRPFYMGEFTRDGNLSDPDNPFLYWLLPIIRVARGQEVEVRNYAAHHAGDPRWVRYGNSEEWVEPKQ